MSTAASLKPKEPSQARARQTRQALIDASIRLFGQKGFDATSTRMIAAEAGVNLAAIAYHFGRKDGLRRACAEEVAERIGAVAGQSLATEGPVDDPNRALDLIEETVRALLRFTSIEPAAADITNFMMREMTQPGGAVQIVYQRMLEPVHKAVCRMWAVATGGDPESEATRIAVFTIFGQSLYFRIARPVVLQRMGWEEIGDAETERIADIVIRNMRLMAKGEAANA